MSIAGIWDYDDGSGCLSIQGQGSNFTYQAGNHQGQIFHQGQIRRAGNQYEMRGNGMFGPVANDLWEGSRDTLNIRTKMQIDGGFLDMYMQQLQPTFSLTRRRPVVAPVQAEEADILDLIEKQEKAKKAKPAEPKKRPAPAAKEQEEEADPMKELEKLVGMAEVKQQIEELDAWAWAQKQRNDQGLESESPSLHMCFTGGPGTGKTTVARIIGGLLKKYDLLDKGEVRECSRADLVGEYLGQTAPKVEKLIQEALGGVLFIDEAYSLTEALGGGGGSKDYGAEAIAILIAGMENHRHELCVVVAGYPDEMERFVDANPGIKSRISRYVTFPDFSEQEMEDVFRSMAKGRNYDLDPRIFEVFKPYVRRAKAIAKPRQWGNARSVRNILERGIGNQSIRLKKKGGKPTKAELQRLEYKDYEFLADSKITAT